MLKLLITCRTAKIHVAILIATGTVFAKRLAFEGLQRILDAILLKSLKFHKIEVQRGGGKETSDEGLVCSPGFDR